MKKQPPKVGQPCTQAVNVPLLLARSRTKSPRLMARIAMHTARMVYRFFIFLNEAPPLRWRLKDKLRSANWPNLRTGVGEPGLEPGTLVLSGLRSNQLSYTPSRTYYTKALPPLQLPHTVHRRSSVVGCPPPFAPLDFCCYNTLGFQAAD